MFSSDAVDEQQTTCLVLSAIRSTEEVKQEKTNNVIQSRLLYANYTRRITRVINVRNNYLMLQVSFRLFHFDNDLIYSHLNNTQIYYIISIFCVNIISYICQTLNYEYIIIFVCQFKWSSKKENGYFILFNNFHVNFSRHKCFYIFHNCT